MIFAVEFLPPKPLIYNGDNMGSPSDDHKKNEPQICLADWDRDGLLDLMVGESYLDKSASAGRVGKVYVMKNRGDAKNYVFEDRIYLNITSPSTA